MIKPRPASEELLREKKQIRQTMLVQRRAYPENLRMHASIDMVERLCGQSFFRAAKTVMAYASMPDEVQLYTFLQICRKLGKKLLLPALSFSKTGKDMEARLLSDTVSIKKETLGIWHAEEQGEKVFFSPMRIDCIVVPGVAFTPQGLRLGMGGGFYDRFLPRAKNAHRVALAYDFQVVPELPATEEDARMDYIITEKQIIICKNEW